jgi:hypothetical protein
VNTDHKIDSGTAQNLNSLLKDPSASTNNIGPTTKEKAPLSEYLQRLGDDHVEAGLNATADDIYEAAAEIRRLTNISDGLDRELTLAKTARDITDQMLGNLSDAILAVISEELEAKIVEMLDVRIREALDDYDPTDHLEFDDAVDRRIADSCIEDIVRDVLDNASVSISI